MSWTRTFTGGEVANIVLVLPSALVSLLLAEFICAIFFPEMGITQDMLGQSWIVENPPRLHLVRSDNRSFEDLLPNQKGRAKLTNSYEYDWETNELGLRGKNLGQIEDDRLRILILGDSQTYGWGLEEDQNYVTKLKYLLERKLKRPIEIINAGVPTYATYQELWKFRQIGEKIMPHLVVVAIHIANKLTPRDAGNDLWFNYKLVKGIQEYGEMMRDEPREEHPKASFLTRHSHLYNKLAHVYQKWRGDEKRLMEMYGLEDPEKYESELKFAWQETRRLLKKINESGKQISGSETIVLVIPERESLLHDDRTVLTELQGARLPIIDTLDMFQDRIGGRLEGWVIRHDGHWNERAHQLIAEAAANFMIEEGFLQI